MSRELNDDVTIIELNENTRVHSSESEQTDSHRTRGQLVLHARATAEDKTHAEPKSLFESAKQAKDDSSTAFGNQWVPSIGAAQLSPDLNQGHTNMSEEEKRGYEYWLKTTQLIERKHFQTHDTWQAQLKKLGQLDFSAIISVNDLPKDTLSEKFKIEATQHLMNRNLCEPKYNSFLGRTKPPSNFNQMPTYVPAIFEENKTVAKSTSATSTKEQAWLAEYAVKQGAFDELLMMKDMADKNEGLKASSMTLGSHRITPNKFIIVSDHNGQPDGTRIQIWSGLKQSFTVASKHFGQNLNQLQNTGEYGLDINYLELPNLTIVRIDPNEIGFCYNRETLQTEKMLPGRYVLQRGCNFIGKATVQNRTGTPSPVKSPSKEREAFRDNVAGNLFVLCVPPNHVAFIGSPQGTFVLTHQAEPYLINQLNGFCFISCASLSMPICATNETTPNYFIVTLQPGEYIIFKDGATPIVWEFNNEHPELNTVHLSGAYFSFNGRLYNNTAESVRVEQVSVFSKRTDQFVVLRDESNNIRFLETSGNQPITLRAPWRYVETVSKSRADYRVGNHGEQVCRIQSSEAEWIGVVSQEGKFETFPPLLDGSAYYFYPQKYTVINVLNINKEGEQSFEVPRVGKVSVVNLTTGRIGTCMINNMYFLLNPAPQPQVFLPPNRYLSSVSVDESYIRAGDVHRIYLKPDERCVVEKNGRAILLPDDVNSLEECDAQQENGVYTFRAEKLKIDGPKNKAEKEYKLGPYQFFNVGVGEVAYGNQNGAVHIWGQGEHRVNVSKNERFSGFFSTNVDPVQIEGFPITSKHGITSHIDIYVTYSIENPDLAIKQFRTHEELHEFIANTTRSEILRLCAMQPPIGYTEGDFTTMQNTKGAKPSNDSEGVQEIEDQFTQHASGLLKNFGIKLGNMHITKWVIDPDFVEKARTLALGLQENRAAYERAQIALQQQGVENNKKTLEAEQKKQAEIIAAQTQAEIESAKAIALAKTEASKAVAEAQRKTQIAEAEVQTTLAKKRAEFEAKAAEAESQTKIAEESIKRLEAERKAATLKNQMESDRLQAEAEQRKKTAALDAETQAFGKTAGQIAEAEAQNRTARAELEAAKLKAERMQILSAAEAFKIKSEGEAKAAAIQAEVAARYPNASGDMLVQLEIARLQAETQKEIAKTTQIVKHTMSDEDTRKALGEQFAAVQGARNVFGLNNSAALFYDRPAGTAGQVVGMKAPGQ